MALQSAMLAALLAFLPAVLVLEMLADAKAVVRASRLVLAVLALKIKDSWQIPRPPQSSP